MLGNVCPTAHGEGKSGVLLQLGRGFSGHCHVPRISPCGDTALPTCRCSGEVSSPVTPTPHASRPQIKQQIPSSAWGHLLIFLPDFHALVRSLSWARHDLISHPTHSAPKAQILCHVLEGAGTALTHGIPFPHDSPGSVPQEKAYHGGVMEMPPRAGPAVPVPLQTCWWPKNCRQRVAKQWLSRQHWQK